VDKEKEETREMDEKKRGGEE
jgi:hypothetical protein